MKFTQIYAKRNPIWDVRFKGFSKVCLINTSTQESIEVKADRIFRVEAPASLAVKPIEGKLTKLVVAGDDKVLYLRSVGIKIDHGLNAIQDQLPPGLVTKRLQRVALLSLFGWIFVIVAVISIVTLVATGMMTDAAKIGGVFAALVFALFRGKVPTLAAWVGCTAEALMRNRKALDDPDARFGRYLSSLVTWFQHGGAAVALVAVIVVFSKFSAYFREKSEAQLVLILYLVLVMLCFVISAGAIGAIVAALVSYVPSLVLGGSRIVRPNSSRLALAIDIVAITIASPFISFSFLLGVVISNVMASKQQPSQLGSGAP